MENKVIEYINNDHLKYKIYDEFNKLKIHKKDLSYVKKDAEILCYFDKNEVRQSIKSPIWGQILKINVDEPTNTIEIILEKCKHDMLYFNQCSHCSFNTKTDKDDSNIITEKHHNKYVSLSKTLNFSKDLAMKEGKKVIDKYLKEKKLILLLDIDNTILHAADIPLSTEEFNTLKDKYKDSFTFFKFKNKQQTVVKLRNGLFEFLEKIKDKYQIYIYTHGNKEYASYVINYLNEILKCNYFSVDRLFARDDNNKDLTNSVYNLPAKEIEKILPTKDSIVLILDDRTDVWKDSNHDALINIYPYFFFYEQRSNNLKSSKFLLEDSDNVIYSIEKLMLFVHESFFKYYEANNKLCDVSKILQAKLKSILMDTEIIFSSLYPREINIYNTKEGIQIQDLGGILHNEEPSESTDLILSKEYKNTPKIKRATELSIPIVNINWIKYCYMYFVKIDNEEFIISKQKPLLNETEITPLSIFEKNKELIGNFYDLNEIQDFINNVNENDEVIN